MKKLMFAILAIALLSSCRQEDETMNKEAEPLLKKTENAYKKAADSVGPVVVIPPKITESTSQTTTTSTAPAQTTAAPASSAP